MPDLILASQSPRRSEILKSVGYDFITLPSKVEETLPDNISIEKIPEYLAKLKAEDVYAKCDVNSVVLGADTIVVIDGIILGKPKNKDDAFRMLNLLSGNEHKVITGCFIRSKDKYISFSDITTVRFNKLSENEINNYIDSGEPMDKAGSYGVQGIGKLFVNSINGDYFSVMGLPIQQVYNGLKEFGILPKLKDI